MPSAHSNRPGRAPWSIDDIAYDAIPVERMRAQRDLFYLLTSASFVEIASDLYTRNLAEYFRDDAAIVRWLEDEWEPEELQHGAALRKYIETIWPEFDWPRAYASFFAEYSQNGDQTIFAPTHALELAGRCVVETGTASFYRMLAADSVDPVLKQIAANISFDEVRHYKNFYQHFLRYAQSEKPSSGEILITLWRKMAEINSRNAYQALKHVHLGAGSTDTSFEATEYRAFRQSVRVRAKQYFPHEMAVKMLLKPLGLGNRTSRVIVPVVAFAANQVIRHSA